MSGFKDAIELVGLAIDGLGVAVIVVGVSVSGVRYVLAVRAVADAYGGLRHDLGRAILLGLELLVAADIVRTVAVSPTLENALVLASSSSSAPSSACRSRWSSRARGRGTRRASP